MRRRRPSYWMVLGVTVIASIFLYLPPYIQLLFGIIGLFVLIKEAVEYRKQKNLINESYIYYGGIPVITLLIIFILGVNYLDMKESTIYYILGLAVFISIITGIIAGIVKLRSGQEEYVRQAKLAFAILIIILPLLVYIVFEIILKHKSMAMFD